ncbi:MAG: PA domain-containing protein, partial [Actinomycetota bacterium]
DQGGSLKRLLVALAATVLAVSMFGTGAVADSKQETKALQEVQRGSNQRSLNDGLIDTNYERDIAQYERAELGPAQAGLPPSKKKMKAVSRLRLTNTDGVISDVTYHRGYAYLGEWVASCAEGEGGTYDSEVHVVDVRNFARPRKVASIPGNGNDWSGEGVHVIRHRNRDLLLLSSEPCDSTVDANVGGMTIVDVTNPRQPQKLHSNFGDWTSGGLDGEDCRLDPDAPCVTPHSVHSVMGWTDGKKAYAVQVDNVEFPDVDIFDISRPWVREPRLIAETGLNDWVDPLVISDQVANGGAIFHHDMQVKKIDGRWRMMVSYWDIGWVLLNVNDPANPRVITDYDYPDPDPLTGFSPPEGNAHQSWWSKNSRWVVGTDEDFNPFRLVGEITTGPSAGDTFDAANGSGTPPVDDQNPLAGPTRWAGRACNIDPAVPAPGSPDEIALVTRGACTFTEKTANVESAGYAGIIVFNSNAAAGGSCSAVIGTSVEGGIPFLFVGRDTGFKLLNTPYDEGVCQDPAQDDGTTLPALGTEGEDVSVTGEFDGWGYVQLFRGDTLRHRGEYAVREALDPRYAKGFGDLTVHEVKTDPRGNNLGYISYYNAGARVVKFDRQGIREVGHFISGRGNNFWGTFPVNQRKKGKKRQGPIPVLMSDRDFGLYVLKYTGNQFTP